MERESDSHMDKYQRKHLRRDTPAEKAPGGRSPQPKSNPGKGRGGHLKHMTETYSSKGKGNPNSRIPLTHPSHTPFHSDVKIQKPTNPKNYFFCHPKDN